MCSLQVTRKSTATLFVEGFKSVLYPPRRASDHTDHAPHRTCNPHDMGEGGQGEAGGRGDRVDEIPSWAAGTLASLCTSPYDVRLAQERFPKIHFHPLHEHAGLALGSAG